MRARLWAVTALVLSLSLVACDGGEGDTTVPTADPGAPPVSVTTLAD
jgi:hypothetical protein